MTAEDRLQFRINLLLQTKEAGRFGLGVNSLQIGARSAGFRSATTEQVTDEIDYLKDKGHLAAVEKEISPEVESFRITAAGRDWLAQNNF